MKKAVNIPTYKKTVEPIERFLTLEQVKNHLRLDCATNTEDTFLQALIDTAHFTVENFTNTLLGLQTWQLKLDFFDSLYLFIEKTPVIEIKSIKYLDTDGIEKTLPTSSYQVDVDSYPCRIYLNDAPVTQWYTLNTATIEFTAGLTDNIPSPLVSAMLLQIGHLYENRQDVITGTIVSEIPKASEYLLNQYKRY